MPNALRQLRRHIKEDPDRATKAWWENYTRRVSRTRVMNGNDDYDLPLLWAIEAKNMGKILGGCYGPDRSIEEVEVEVAERIENQERRR